MLLSQQSTADAQNGDDDGDVRFVSSVVVGADDNAADLRSLNQR